MSDLKVHPITPSQFLYDYYEPQHYNPQKQKQEMEHKEEDASFEMFLQKSIDKTSFISAIEKLCKKYL